MQKDLNPGATAFELPELPYGLTQETGEVEAKRG
jgi:hypothetical protein